MDYTELLKELQEYFADLLIIQYRGAKKNRDLIKLLVNLIFANNLALQIKDLTVNVEESIGAQLDVVGKWVGIDRYYSGELWTHPYLAYPLYSTIQNGTYSEWQGGFSSYSTFEDNNGGFLTYKTWQDVRTTVNKIGDEYFRALIKLKIIKNSINHTCKKIDNAIWNWSNGNVYTTWNTMQVTYHYTSLYKDLMALANYKKILPVPTGCTLILEEITND